MIEMPEHFIGKDESLIRRIQEHFLGKGEKNV